MRAHSIRIPIIVLAATLGLLISSTMAGGAQPDKGSYSYTGIDGASGYPTFHVSFKVKGEPGHRKVTEFFFGLRFVCGDTVSVGSMNVKPNGKFKGTAQGENPGGDTYTAKIKGKFKTKTKAVGRISGGCMGKPGKKFIAKLGGYEACHPPGPACRASRLSQGAAIR